MPFPLGDYTPYGYLRNPFHRASGAWERLEGGNLKTCDDAVGMEWAYAWHRGTSARAGVVLTYKGSGETCLTRSDFAAIGYTSRYHSSNVISFDWQVGGLEVSARFFLVDEAIAVRVDARNLGAQPQEVRMGVQGRAWAAEATSEVSHTDGSVVFNSTDGSPAFHALVARGADGATEPASDLIRSAAGEVQGGWETIWHLSPGESANALATLGRADSQHEALAAARTALSRADERLVDLLDEDNRFYESCPRLEGDWPAHWREGLIYDFETTRMCVMPARGIFQDVWPAWMVSWPRVVVAEGTLDMLRLSYADPALAQRALLTLFRDAPADNVPCVFEDGSPNMVAADGSICGTSPAWCLPFHNLKLVYLRTLDRAWLAEIYPYLGRYVQWWLVHRSDGQGWVVYKCTWEAGEDGNRRLDPTASGSADISGRIRPVELQATMAYSAGVLAFFAAELRRQSDAVKWRSIERDYRDRARALFDPSTQRFRDWLIQDRCFQMDSSKESYWGSDSLRFSALSLTPLLGEIATPTQVRALQREVRLHAAPPWTSWPSWCHVLAECANACELTDVRGEIAQSVLDRVYRATDRRTLDELRRPTPGAAPEYWPEDWRAWGASDAYGWGATTANLLIRHLMGVQESPDTSGWVLELAPAITANLEQPKARYTVRRLNYRGEVFDLTYQCLADGLRVELELDRPRLCVVSPAGNAGSPFYSSDTPGSYHTFYLANGGRYRLQLVH